MPDDHSKAYTVTVTLTVHPDTDEHLQNEQAIRGEVESWLASLHATVQSVNVRPADAKE